MDPRAFLEYLHVRSGGAVAPAWRPEWIFVGGTEPGSAPLVVPPPCATVEEWESSLDEPAEKRYADLPDPLRAPPSVEPDDSTRRIARG
jgi:hypothetical protein